MLKEAVRGKSQGRCYGVAQLAHNVRHGVIFLTHVSIINPNREADNQAIEVARAEADTVVAREEDARANEQIYELAKQFEEFRKQMFDMFQSRHTGPSSAPPSEHSHYNFSEDEEDDVDPAVTVDDDDDND
ncbi:unnamed protein product [Vicia faba]|uniref:Uncharacterized protein n=1 Tax=Vicia faba TaxID=3906 RepID=A0AAV0YIB7_VICFA|nr:unnamed protein product [Vicia faba]